MKKIFFTILLSSMAVSLFAQYYATKTGHISFKSETPIETIEANNYQVNTTLNTETGDFVFSVLIKAFEFEKILMQKHFNDNYMESDTYPKSTFIGKIKDIDSVDFTTPGDYDVDVSGDLTIHGVTKTVGVKGKVSVSESKQINATSSFSIRLEDYNIKRPKSVIKNISEIIYINVDVTLKKIE